MVKNTHLIIMIALIFFIILSGTATAEEKGLLKASPEYYDLILKENQPVIKTITLSNNANYTIKGQLIGSHYLCNGPSLDVLGDIHIEIPENSSIKIKVIITGAGQATTCGMDVHITLRNETGRKFIQRLPVCSVQTVPGFGFIGFSILTMASFITVIHISTRANKRNRY